MLAAARDPAPEPGQEGGPLRRLRASLVQMATPTGRPLTRTDVLSTSEVAELLGIPRSTVHELARRGDLPARRVGRRWLFLRDRVAAAVTPLDDPGAWSPRNGA
jgi:excisionase family DNA binding protein